MAGTTSPPAGARELEAGACSHDGLVLRASSGVYLVHDLEDATRPPLECSLRGNLKKNFSYSTSASAPRRVVRARRPCSADTVAVGDRVRFALTSGHAGVIQEVLPRTSRFARASFRGQEQTLVTNLDQLVIVFACADPSPDLYWIDRWLVAAEAYGLQPLLVWNKRDLVDETTFSGLCQPFHALGYPASATSAPLRLGLDELADALNGRVSALTGPSGVGKSSLINALAPSAERAIGRVGLSGGHGRHTTTARELIPLDTGGWVADTPGLRQLTLLQMEQSDLEECFPEIRDLDGACRFPDCRHRSEPSCRVREALSAGHLSARRYESFLRLQQECCGP